MSGLIEEKKITVKGVGGTEKEFIISKFPAIAGREIITGYPINNIPKLLEYKASEELMLKLMNYVAVEVDGHIIRLSSAALIDNHVTDADMLLKIEFEALRYNTDFFNIAKKSLFLDSGVLKEYIISTIKTWTTSLQSSSQKGKRP